MTAIAIEPGITIENLPDPDADIPCEIEVGTPRVRCGKPAVCRAHVRCSCEEKATFMCRECLGMLGAGEISCSALIHIPVFLGTL